MYAYVWLCAIMCGAAVAALPEIALRLLRRKVTHALLRMHSGPPHSRSMLCLTPRVAAMLRRWLWGGFWRCLATAPVLAVWGHWPGGCNMSCA